jgi:hypothetical protein
MIDSSNVNPWRVRLRSLFFYTFLSACIARWIGHYGTGLGILVMWLALVGALIGGLMAIITWVCARWRSHQRNEDSLSCDLSVCIHAGLAAALIWGAVFFVLHLGSISAVNANGLSAQALTMRDGTPRPINGFNFVLFASAMFWAFTNSLAAATRRLRSAWPSYLAQVSIIPSLALAVIVPMLLIAMLYSAAQSPGYMNCGGPIELAVILWSAIAGILGGVCGMVTGTAWLWSYNARNSPSDRIFMWCIAIGMILLITEIGLHDWIPNFG